VIINSIISWLTVSDLDDALKKAQVDVIVRYARGNTAFQNGNISDLQELDALHKEGDSAIEYLVVQQQKARNDCAERLRN
jgi:hypothetical protein